MSLTRIHIARTPGEPETWGISVVRLAIGPHQRANRILAGYSGVPKNEVESYAMDLATTYGATMPFVCDAPWRRLLATELELWCESERIPPEIARLPVEQMLTFHHRLTPEQRAYLTEFLDRVERAESRCPQEE